MGAGNHKGGLAGQKVMRQCLGEGNVGNAKFGQCDGLRVRFSYGIADHNKVRARRKVFSSVPILHRDVAGGQKITHGWIDICVRTGNRITGIFQHARKGPHAGAADAHYVNVVDKVRKAIERREQIHR